MSAVLADELVLSGQALLRQARVAQGLSRRAAEFDPQPPIAVVRELRPARMAPVVVSAVRQPRVQEPSWRLTDRGIAVVLALVLGLFLTGVVVLVTSFLAVSDAPLAAPVAAAAALGGGR